LQAAPDYRKLSGFFVIFHADLLFLPFGVPLGVVVYTIPSFPALYNKIEHYEKSISCHVIDAFLSLGSKCTGGK
jgi:hypothetical protein